MSLLLTPLDGRITLKGVLGIGGMGEVHRAWDAGLERPVAVKFLRSSDPKEADRLLLEARLQARVEHPNVVRVLDTGTLEGRPCILLQLVEGQTLADLDPGTSWHVRVGLAIQAARGLGTAHRMGLVHRDVKPANILVEESSEGGRALLSDFGLARDEEGGLTRSGLMMGSVDFMAPEQVTGAAPVDFRADIYGLGATLYAVLAGRPPFRHNPGPHAAARTGDLLGATRGGDLHPGDLLRRVLEEAPNPLTGEVPHLPKDLGIVVAKAMEKEPGRRYATAEAFADDLERVLRAEPILARPMGWSERGGRWVRRNPIPAKALGAALFTVIAASGFASWNNRQSTLATLGAVAAGAEAKTLELRLRMAHLAPAHDLRPVKAELRKGLDHLQGQAGPAAAASAYARGRVLLLLDELEEAQQALEQAQRLGYRGPDLEEALGYVFGRRFARARPQIEGLKDEKLRAQRLETLRRELQVPALSHLAGAGNTLHQHAFIALVDNRYEAARTFARRSRAENPEQLESTLLEGQAWLQEATEAQNGGDPARATRCVEEGRRVGEALLLDLRSDPEVPLLMARLLEVQVSFDQQRGQPIQKAFHEGLAWTDRALALDPDWAEAWKVRGSILEAGAKEATNIGELTAISIGVQQVEASRRAVALRPLDAGGLRALAKALYTLGHSQLMQQKNPLESLREGRMVALRSEPLEPWHPSGPHLAVINTLDEARYLLTHSQDSAEVLGIAEAILLRLEGMAGLSPKLLHAKRADLRGLQAQLAWSRGQDPDPLQADSHAQYEALLALDPEALGRSTDIGYSAVTWAQSRVASGRPVRAILARVEPTLARGLARSPRQPLLLYYRAWLLGLKLFDRREGFSEATDPALCREALAAFAQAQAAMKNPDVLEIRAWMHLAMAEAGRAGSAELARIDFQGACDRDPGARDPRMGLARALRLQGRPGDLERARACLETLVDKAKEDAELMVHQAILLADSGQVEASAKVRARALVLQPLLVGHPLLARVRSLPQVKALQAPVAAAGPAHLAGTAPGP
jgi:serine/threonine-protein kinase